MSDQSILSIESDTSRSGEISPDSDLSTVSIATMDIFTETEPIGWNERSLLAPPASAAPSQADEFSQPLRRADMPLQFARPADSADLEFMTEPALEQWYRGGND